MHEHELADSVLVYCTLDAILWSSMEYQNSFVYVKLSRYTLTQFIVEQLRDKFSWVHVSFRIKLDAPYVCTYYIPYSKESVLGILIRSQLKLSGKRIYINAVTPSTERNRWSIRREEKWTLDVSFVGGAAFFHRNSASLIGSKLEFANFLN